MIDRFPYGKAPFWLAVLALASSLVVLVGGARRAQQRADLTFALYAPNHMGLYRRVVPEFERKHQVKVSLQLVHETALQTRLENAMLAGTEVPDLVELPADAMAYFGRGPLDEIGLSDLTARLSAEGYRARLVESRLSLWSSRGHVFALPHDVHPVQLGYRADLVEALGIDVSKLTTWDAFVDAAHRVVRDLDGDGIIDRYMIDMPTAGAWGLNILLLQRGVNLFDADGRVTFNQPLTVDTMLWYLHQAYGKDRIIYECGWGQSLAKAMTDGLVLFYIVPDWRSFVIQTEVPRLKGKMKLMPLPAWEPGGRRTSVWGGTGLAITKASRQQALAWEFAKFLYFNGPELGKRFADDNIIPPFKDAWNLPELQQPNEFYSGQRLGASYAALAPDTPPVWTTPYTSLADGKLSEVFLRAVARFRAQGDAGLREYIQAELDGAEAYMNAIIGRNVFARK